MNKPSKFQRDAAKWQKSQAKKRTKDKAKKAASAEWAAKARKCYDRDGGCSRASGRRLEFRCANPFKVADPHHIKWKSAGGSDEESNVVTVSRGEHDRIHMRGNYTTRLEVEGDSNATLTWREFDAETGKLLREWESPCPTA